MKNLKRESIISIAVICLVIIMPLLTQAQNMPDLGELETQGDRGFSLMNKWTKSAAILIGGLGTCVTAVKVWSGNQTWQWITMFIIFVVILIAGMSMFALT